MTDEKTIDLDLNDLTIAEVEILEDRSGVPFKDLSTSLQEGASGRLLHTLAYIGMRRVNPGTTWEEAGEISVRELFDSKEKGAALPPPPPVASES